MLVNRFIFIIILCSFLFNRDSVPEKYKTVSGEITYVTTDAFYINTGKKNGVSIGDIAKVYRGTQQIGSGEVSHISSKSAVCSILDGSDFRPGDKTEILVRNRIPAEAESPPPPGITPESVKRKKMIGGSITAKILYENNGNGQVYSRQQSYFSLNSQGIAGIPLSLSATGNLFLTSNGKTTVSPQINQLDVRYDRSFGNWQISVGRILDVSASGTGPTDGFRLSRELSTLNLSIITGVWDSSDGRKDVKNTFSIRWKQVPFHLTSLNLDLITRKYSGYVDNFFSFRSTIVNTRRWSGAISGLIHVFDGNNMQFDPNQLNVGISWNYSRKIMASFSYNSTSGTGSLGRYSTDQIQNLKNGSLTSSVRYEISPILRTTFSSSLHQIEGSGDGHSFALMLETDHWSAHKMGLSVAADFFASPFYRTYLFKTAISKRTYLWRVRSEARLLNQSFRPDRRVTHSYYLIFEASRKMMKNYYLGSHVELTAVGGSWESYVSIDYTIRF